MSIFADSGKNVKPTLKKVLKNGENYRPISLVSVISKVVEKSINKQPIFYLENSNQLWSFVIVRYGVVVALNISKAFDCAWHMMLFLTSYFLTEYLQNFAFV